MQFRKNFPTNQINYEIMSYPHFLIILYDLQLKLNLVDIKRLFVESIDFTPENKYILRGVVTCPSDDHFTCYIDKLNLINSPKDLKLIYNFYYDDLLFDGAIQIYNDKNVLFIDNENPIIPYICI